MPAPGKPDKSAIDEIEVHCLFEAIRLRYGYDFREYTGASLRRRVASEVMRSGFANVAELQHRALHDPTYLRELIGALTVATTEMFRDPDFFAALRSTVIPHLRSWPFIRIWHAGCSTGEEVYSLAIVLREEGLLDRARIYATDLSEAALAIAREGIFNAEDIPEYTRQYQKAGGRESFASYYRAKYDQAVLDASLRENILFSSHNLVSDQVFGEMNLILCRNVIIYFQRPLQDRVLSLFRDSLCRDGVLCLGTKETLRFSSTAHAFEPMNDGLRIYRKVAQ